MCKLVLRPFCGVGEDRVNCNCSKTSIKGAGLGSEVVGLYDSFIFDNN